MGVTGEGGGTVARVVWGRERDIFQGLSRVHDRDGYEWAGCRHARGRGNMHVAGRQGMLLKQGKGGTRQGSGGQGRVKLGWSGGIGT